MRPNALFQLLLLTAAAVAWAAPRGTSFISMEEYKKYDDKVKHISQKQFLDQLREDQGVTWLIFFGSNQCGHCRAATPHWLNLQDQYFDSLESQGMRMRKIEFTENPEIFGPTQENIEYFPHFRVYHDGKKAEDFPKDEITTESLIEYTRTIFKKYRSTGAILEAKKIDTLAKEIETAIKQLTDIADAPLREHDTINPKGEVVVLDVAAFEEKVKSGPWFIKFYAPWCGHCKQLAPIFQALAPTLKRRVNVAQVDCTTEVAVCNKYNIRGYPTLKFFMDGVPSGQEYKGARSIDALKEFCLGFVSKAYFTAVKAEEVKDIVKKEDVSFFLVYKPSSVEASKDNVVNLVTDAWKKLRFTSKLFVSPDPSSILQIDANFHPDPKPVLMSVKDNGQEKYIFTGLSGSKTATAADIIEWAQLHKTPLVRQLDADNSDEILGTDRLVIMAISDPTDTQVHERTISVLKQSARIVINREDVASKAIFVWLDGVKWGDYVRRVYGNEIADKKPSIVIADPTQELYYDVGVDGLRFEAKEESILTAITQVTQKKLKPKFTNGWFSSVMKSIGNFFKPFILLIANHPIMFALLALSLIIMFVSWVTLEENPQYNRVKSDPKSH